MISYSDHTLSHYLEKLSSREPVPGGGSAAAVSGALGAALIAMSARYSTGKGKSALIEHQIHLLITQVDAARMKFIELAGHDAQVYLNMVSSRKSGDKAAAQKAQEEASRVPADIIKLCQDCLALTPLLHQEGNPHLLSDVKAAEAFLKAAIEAAKCMQEANA
jgi:formiminotetrahydrofolate cyclodeaminase